MNNNDTVTASTLAPIHTAFYVADWTTATLVYTDPQFYYVRVEAGSAVIEIHSPWRADVIQGSETRQVTPTVEAIEVYNTLTAHL